MKLPRKLKKGIRTLNGKPKTKWQRRGRIVTIRLLFSIGRLAAAIATVSTFPHNVQNKFHSGGIVTDSPQPWINQGECIISNPPQRF